MRQWRERQKENKEAPNHKRSECTKLTFVEKHTNWWEMCKLLQVRPASGFVSPQKDYHILQRIERIHVRTNQVTDFCSEVRFSDKVCCTTSTRSTQELKSSMKQNNAQSNVKLPTIGTNIMRTQSLHLLGLPRAHTLTQSTHT